MVYPGMYVLVSLIQGLEAPLAKKTAGQRFAALLVAEYQNRNSVHIRVNPTARARLYRRFRQSLGLMPCEARKAWLKAAALG